MGYYPPSKHTANGRLHPHSRNQSSRPGGPGATRRHWKLFSASGGCGQNNSRSPRRQAGPNPARQVFPVIAGRLNASILILQICGVMQFWGVSSDDGNASGGNSVRPLPKPANCNAKAARWPGVVHCLLDNPTSCTHARYFNEQAYCTHPNRADFAAKARSHKKTHAAGSGPAGLAASGNEE